MNAEQCKASLDLLKQADDQASQRLFENLESFLDASDRQISQLAQLRLMEQGDDVTTQSLVDALSSEVDQAGADPT